MNTSLPDDVGIYGLEALFQDWIVDNPQTPMVVPQTSVKFEVKFLAPQNVCSSSCNVTLLRFTQDPQLRSRELPSDGSSALRETLSETEKYSATGAVTWNGGVSLGHYCAVSQNYQLKGRTIVELGAGTGVCGLMVAASGGFVTTTDRNEILPVLKHNVNANRETVVAAQGQIQVQEYSWGTKSSRNFPRGRTFDFILAADCIYDMEGIAPLMQAFKDLSHPISNSKKRNEVSKNVERANIAPSSCNSCEEEDTNPETSDNGTTLMNEQNSCQVPPKLSNPDVYIKTDESTETDAEISSTVIIVAYDTAIGHYDVYKAFHKAASIDFKIKKIPQSLCDPSYTSKFINIYELQLKDDNSSRTPK